MKADRGLIQALETADTVAADCQITREVKQKTQALSTAQAKLTSSLAPPLEEVALGNLGPDKLRRIHDHIRSVVLPVISLGQFSRMQSERAYGVEGGDRSAIRREQYREMLKAVRGSFSTSTYISVNGIKNALLTLGLQPLSCLDVYSESNLGRSPRPGDTNFVGLLKDSVEDLMKSKDQMLGTWQEMYSAESAPESSY